MAPMDGMVRGGLAGLFGTVCMSGLMAAGRAAGLMRRPPPVEITGRVEQAAGIRDDLREPAFTASWVVAHFAYGAAAGAAYSTLRPLLPASPVAAGLLWGAAVWAGSYLALMPALRLYPSLRRDAPGRVGVMVAAHAAYGVSTAAAERVLARSGYRASAALYR